MDTLSSRTSQSLQLVQAVLLLMDPVALLMGYVSTFYINIVTHPAISHLLLLVVINQSNIVLSPNAASGTSGNYPNYLLAIYLLRINGKFCRPCVPGAPMDW